MLKFITGNKRKFEEVRELIWPVKIKQLNISLNEIQDINSRNVIRHKLTEAFRHHKGPFIIEDDSVTLECLGGKLPGPLIKFFLQEITLRRLYKLVKKMGNDRASAYALIAYAYSPSRVKFFWGDARGRIVSPRGSYKFGYDEIFQPFGSKLTFSQMKAKGDLSKSPRARAVEKLKKYLLKH